MKGSLNNAILRDEKEAFDIVRARFSLVDVILCYRRDNDFEPALSSLEMALGCWSDVLPGRFMLMAAKPGALTE